MEFPFLSGLVNKLRHIVTRNEYKSRVSCIYRLYYSHVLNNFTAIKVNITYKSELLRPVCRKGYVEQLTFPRILIIPNIYVRYD